MNCAEYRDRLVACAEGLLSREESLNCRAHLESCADCAAEYRAITSLQQRLIARGRVAAEVAVVESVMRRVLQETNAKETVMSKLFKYRWRFGLGAAAGAVAILGIVLLSVPGAQATAVEVMSRGAQAVASLRSIHLRGELRTYPQDNFSYINADCPFCPIELWKQFEPELKWRIEKPKRAAVMDGQSTVMLIKSTDTAVRLPQRTTSAFDTQWLQRIANLSETITNEIKNALARGWQLSLDNETGADGRLKCVVTIMAKSGVPDDDYLKNTFLDNADTRRVYRFDDQTGLLEGVQIYLVRLSGEVKIFDLTQIDYNQPMDPETWKLELPADVGWVQLEPPKLPNNETYASMTAEQAARAFFEACSRKDWNEAGKFMSPITDRMKQSLGGLEILSIGDSFTSQAYPGRFVPYEIRLSEEEFDVRVSNANPAGRYVVTGIYDSQLQHGHEMKWTNAPAILPNNDVYARMTPLEAVKSYLDAIAKLDWDEMRKFAPDYDVDNFKAQLEEAAQKSGMDPRKLIPTREALEAFWSAKQSAWFVKCRTVRTKKWNLALRKDNPAGRWQVDGGL